jgi:hypothetical protein
MDHNTSEEVEEDFRYRDYKLYDNTLTSSKDRVLYKHLKDINGLVKEVIQFKEELFFINENGRKFIDCKISNFLRITKFYLDNYWDLETYFESSGHRLNPYVQLYRDSKPRDLLAVYTYLNDYKSCGYDDDKLLMCLDKFNGFVENIRIGSDNPEFHASVNNYQRPFNKNYKSLIDYINYLFDEYKRLLVLRTDFHYRKDVDTKYLTENERNERYWQAKKDLEHFLNNRRSNTIFDHMVGYAWKLEFAPITGFHYHLFFFFNEKMVRQDVKLAQRIGEYWQNNITQGRGRYFNCNRKKNEYKFLGIGKIRRKDVEKRKGLEKAAEYLTKTDDHNARLIALEKNGRIFDRGKMPKNRKRGQTESI